MSATIVAPATPAASGGIGVLRVSGPLSLELTRPLTRGLVESPEPRRAYFVDFVDADGEVLDQGLFLYFRAPNSFTGEDVVELQTHGSVRLLQLLQARVLADGRARLAGPGEFSRRAFLNGRIDLSRAEAISELVSADSEAAVRAAAAQLAGGLSKQVRALRTSLLAVRTDIEGVLNFPEEAEGADAELPARLRPLLQQVEELLSRAAQGRLLRRGAKVVLFGPVNAGKSTLFNALLGEARALVDEEPGTTRDVLEARLEWRGLGVTLVDTAGLREAPGRIEAQGIARAREALESADLCVLVVPPEVTESERADWRREVDRTPLLEVRSKCDVSAPRSGEPLLRVSAVSGQGLDELRAAVWELLWRDGAPGAVASVSERHADALRRAGENLALALEATRVSTLEVVSGELGLALDALGEITGESASAALLDAIFQRFCIGK